MDPHDLYRMNDCLLALLARCTCFRYETWLQTWIWARLTSVQSQLSVEKAIARRAVAMIPVMVARDSVTAEHGISATLSLMSSSSLLPLRPSSVSFTSHSPRNLRAYLLPFTWASAHVPEKAELPREACYRAVFLQMRRRGGELDRENGLWRTRRHAGRRRGVAREFGGSSEPRDLVDATSTSFRMRAPPRCTSHHRSSGNGNDTNGPTRLEGKPEPRASRENKEREPDPRWGPTRSLGQVYYLCFTCSGAQRA